ncbi:MAG: hypothetical protein WC569_05620 [Candidatus Omnitrophota bacterium]
MLEREKFLILPRRFVSLSFLELPSVNDGEIRGMLECQVAGMILCQRQDIVMGYRHVGFFRKGYSHVMLAVATRNLVEEIAGGRGEGVKAVLLETELWYLYLVTRRLLSPDKKILAIDVNDGQAELLIIDRMRPIFSMSLRREDLFLKGPGYSFDMAAERNNLDEVIITYRGEIDMAGFRAVLKDYSGAPLNFHERREDILSGEKRSGFEPAINLLKQDTVEEEAVSRKDLLVTFILLSGIALISTAIFIF